MENPARFEAKHPAGSGKLWKPAAHFRLRRSRLSPFSLPLGPGALLRRLMRFTRAGKPHPQFFFPDFPPRHAGGLLKHLSRHCEIAGGTRTACGWRISMTCCSRRRRPAGCSANCGMHHCQPYLLPVPLWLIHGFPGPAPSRPRSAQDKTGPLSRCWVSFRPHTNGSAPQVRSGKSLDHIYVVHTAAPDFTGNGLPNETLADRKPRR